MSRVEMNTAEPEGRCTECGAPIEEGIFCEDCAPEFYEDPEEYDWEDDGTGFRR